jgi:hypothetical protein
MEGLNYKFKIVMKDGSEYNNEYTLNVGEIAYIHIIPNAGLLPPYFFFFTKDTLKIERFFGKAFLSTSGKKDYFYCLHTDKCKIFINAFDGTVVFTNDLKYKIKNR